MKKKIIGHLLGIVILAARAMVSHGTRAGQQVQENDSKPDRADIQPVRVIQGVPILPSTESRSILQTISLR